MATKKAAARAKKEVLPKETPREPEPVAAVDNVDLLDDLRLMFSVELGRTSKRVQEVLDLGEQSLIELDRMVGDPVNVLLNGKLFARGEVVTVREHFGVKITEVLGQDGKEGHHGP